MSNWLKTILFLAGSALLTHLIPFSSLFRNLDTMIHEFGHAVVTLALSGNVMYIELFSNHSGVTYSSISKPWTTIPIALAGYTTASLYAMFLFYAYARGKQRLGLQVTTIIAIAALVLFVRNDFGMVWLIGFIVLNILVLALGARWIRDFYYLLLAFLSLEESVFGPLSLTLYALIDPRKAGDATNLALHSVIPAVLWAGSFSLFSLWCAKQAIQAFLRRGKHKQAAPHKSFLQEN